MQLFPFQEVGVKFLLSNERCLLADEMGLGKTIQVLSALREVTGDILIICPASLCLMWKEESSNWFKERNFTIHSYNYLQKHVNVKKLLEETFSVIVCDEAHYLKNFKSKTCIGFISLIENYTQKIWMLTGTPATRSGQDYYCYLEIIQKGKWGTYYQFSEMFCDSRPNPFSRGRGKFYTGVKEGKKELLKLAFSKIALRRKKEQVLTELPGVLSKNLPVEVSSEIIASSLKVEREVVKDLIDRGLPIPAHVSSVRRSIGLAKVKTALEFINNCYEPLVVFCCHIDVLSTLRLELPKAVTITGDDSAKEKNNSVSAFQDGESNVVLCNIKAGGVGITLHRASHVLFVELDWSPAVMEQAVARVLRIGQKAGCVNVTYLIGYKTIDETVIEILRSKSRFMKEVLGDK